MPDRPDAKIGLPLRLRFHDRLAGALLQAAYGEQAPVESVGVLQIDSVGCDVDGGAELFTMPLDGGAELVLLIGGDIAAKAQKLAARTGVAAAGLAVFPKAGENPDLLIAAAARAAGESKRLGGRLCEAMPLIQEAEPPTVSPGSLQLHYQPQLDLRYDRILSAEALIRPGPGRAVEASTAWLIAAAGRAGTLNEISVWVFETLCQDAARWSAQGLPPLTLAMNLSLDQLRDDGFVEVFEEQLPGMRPAGGVELELTETAPPHSLDQVVPQLERLKRRGARFVLDDLGSGYASVSLLDHLPLDKVKLDRSLIAQCDAGGLQREELSTLLRFAHDRELTVVAEGVETAAQVDLLRALGCDACQGYHVCPPLTAVALAASLRSLNKRAGMPDVGEDMQDPHREPL